MSHLKDDKQKYPIEECLFNNFVNLTKINNAEFLLKSPKVASDLFLFLQ